MQYNGPMLLYLLGLSHARFDLAAGYLVVRLPLLTVLRLRLLRSQML